MIELHVRSIDIDHDNSVCKYLITLSMRLSAIQLRPSANPSEIIYQL